MTAVVLSVLVIYAVLVSVGLVLRIRTGVAEADAAPLSPELLDALAESPPGERAKALVELERLRRSDSPWYERSLSAIGVLAFFSMVVGTGIQTVRSSVTEAAAERAREEIQQLEADREEAERIIGDLSGVLIEQWFESGRVAEGGLSVLAHRAAWLEGQESSDTAHLRDRFSISLILGEYRVAADLLERYAGLLDATIPADRVSLAEYYYLSGAPRSASDMLGQAMRETGSLPPATLLRVAALEVALGGESETRADEIARAFREDRSTALQRIEGAVRRLRESALGMRP